MRIARFVENARVRAEGDREVARLHQDKLDHQQMLLKHAVSPALLRFSPYTPHLVVADKNRFRSDGLSARQGWGSSEV